MGMLEVELQQCTHKYQQLELQVGGHLMECKGG